MYIHTYIPAGRQVSKALRSSLVHTDDLGVILGVQTDTQSANSPWKDLHTLVSSSRRPSNVHANACVTPRSNDSNTNVCPEADPQGSVVWMRQICVLEARLSDLVDVANRRPLARGGL